MKIFLRFILLMLFPIFIRAEVKTVLPEIKKILDIKPVDKNKMNQNMFLSLVSLDMLAKGEGLEARKQEILDRIDKLKEAIQKKDHLLLNKILYSHQQMDNIYKTYCDKLFDLNCVDQIIADRESVTEIIAQNQELLNYYKQSIKLPNYDSYLINDGYYILISLRQLHWLSNLRLAEAIYAINNNEVDNGLVILQEEIDFNKKILASPNIGHSSYYAAQRRLYTTYQVVERLLDLPIMSAELTKPKLISLLAPFSNREQQVLASIVEQLRNESLMITYTLPDEFNGNEELFDPLGTMREQAAKDNIVLTWNKEKTINDLYKYHDSSVKAGKLVLPQSSSYYLQYLKHNEPNRLSLKEIVELYGKDNVVGNFWIYGSPYNANFIFLSFYDLAGYRALIETKLKIKQAGIEKKQVPEFLKALKSQFSNPYSKQPFVWNNEKQTLSFDWLQKDKDKSRYGEQATINIKFIK